MQTATHDKIENYLGKLRAGLRGLGNQQVDDIIEELRGHLLDKSIVDGELSSERVEAAIESLGTPEDLAGEYMTDAALARAEVSHSPFQILAGLYRWATLSLSGFLLLFVSFVGYSFGGALILSALLKGVHPQSAGLWILPDSDLHLSLRLGFGNAPAGGHDVLGWWIVPIGLAGGVGAVMLTTQFAIWCVRSYRKSRPLRAHNPAT